MLRLQIVLVGVLIGALLLAGFGNKRLREQLNRASRTLSAANKTESELQTCTKALGDYKLRAMGAESEKQTLHIKTVQMDNEIKGLKAKVNKLTEKDKEIEKLKGDLKKVTDNEKELKKQLQEAQKALDVMAKEDEARRAKAAQKTKDSTTPEQKPPKQKQ